MLELVGDFFGRKKECVVAGISGGGPPGAHEAGARPGGGRAMDPRGQVLAPLMCSQCQIFSNILEKSYFIFRAFGELLFSGYFYMARINQKTDRKNTIFTLFQLNNRK